MFQPLIHSPNDLSGQGWARPDSGALPGSHVGVGSYRVGSSLAAFSGTLTGSLVSIQCKHDAGVVGSDLTY